MHALTRSTWRTIWMVAFMAGFVGGWASSALLHSAHAAQGSSADGCSGHDCEVASLTSAAGISGTSLTANGALISTAGAGTTSGILPNGAYFFTAANRVNLGTPSHYFSDNGDNMSIDANSVGGQIILSAPHITLATNDELLSFGGQYPGSHSGAQGIENNSGGNPVYIADAQGLNIYPVGALKTCTSVASAMGNDGDAPEGTIMTDNAAGGASGHVTRLCICTSDGTSTYTWRNLRTGTNGTATTCAD